VLMTVPFFLPALVAGVAIAWLYKDSTAKLNKAFSEELSR
jgi:ABC-type sulfate transport system permease component